LKVGEVSQPVLTPFGFHLIRVDEHKGDTLALRHILVRVQPSDTSTTRIDREADELSKMAGSGEQGAKLDTAAKKLGLTISRVQAFEGEPAVLNGCHGSERQRMGVRGRKTWRDERAVR
jgi:peptidyl-prolyl cis-trans isomerase D